MPTFRLDYEWGGHRGYLEPVDVKWQERGYSVTGGGSVRRATVEAVVPFDAARVANALPLTARGRLSVDGELLLEGAMDLAYGPPTAEGGTPVEFVLADDEAEETGTWPPTREPTINRRPDDVVDARYTATFDIYPETQDTGVLSIEPVLRSDEDSPYQDIAEPGEGQYLPYPFGAPGTTERPGSPAWWIDESLAPGNSDKLIIAGRRVECATVRIFGPDGTNEDERSSVAGVPVHHSDVGQGQVIAYVNVADLTGMAFRPDLRWYVSFCEGRAAPGGAGDVILDVLAYSRLRVDMDAWLSVRAILNRYTLAGYTDRPSLAMQWLRQSLVPFLPLAVDAGPRGYRPVLDPWLNDPTDDAMRLVDGHGVRLAGPVRSRYPQRTSAVTVRYGYGPAHGRCRNAVTLGIEDTPYPLALPVRSVAGPLDYECRWTWDRATAQAMAQTVLLRQAVSPRSIRLQVTEPDRFGYAAGRGRLYVGRRLRFTSTDLRLTDAHAVVSEVETDDRRMLVTVDLRDDIIRGDKFQTA